MKKPGIAGIHCALAGHITYAPQESALADRLHVNTPQGPAWRCLRCGEYVIGDPVGTGPAQQAPVVPHGRVLRDLWILRALAVERFTKGTLLLVGAFAVWRFAGAQNSFSQLLADESTLLTPATERLGWQLESSTIWRWATEAANADPRTLRLVVFALLAYGALQWSEAVGLWLGRRWGEYLAVVATSAFLPLEIHELLDRVTVLRVALLIINVAAVVWLLWSKRLFGIRGGGTAYEASRHEDSILTVEAAAIAAPAAS